MDLKTGLHPSHDLHALISKNGSITPLSAGWRCTFSDLKVNNLSDLSKTISKEDGPKLKTLIECKTPALLRIKTNQQVRTIRFSLTLLNKEESLISGIDITNELGPSRTEISEYKVLEDVFAQAPCLAAVTVGRDFEFIFANTLYKKLVGGREIVGLPLNEAIPNLDPEVWDILIEVYQTGKIFEAVDLKMSADWNGDGVLTEKFFTLVYSPLRNDRNDVVGVWTFAFDTTESKKTESLLDISKRLTAMGSMAANVAHEINNPLTYIMGNIEILNKKVEKDTQTAKLLTNTAQGLLRIEEIVKNLKGLSRNHAKKHTKFSIKDALDEALRYTQLTTDKTAIVSSSCPNDLSYFGNRGEFIQVIVNLIINASNAMPERKKADNKINIVTITDKDLIKISVEDNGKGIEDAHLPKIFDPFYTDQHGREGTGLGLPLCQKMLHEMNGSISVKSHLNKGSKFEITLKNTATSSS